MKTILINGVETFIGADASALDRKKKTVVFLHGSGMNHKSWQTIPAWFLDNNFNVIAPDFPAHSDSSGAAFSTIEESTQWLKLLESQLNVQFDYLVGHSQGFLTALEFAARYSEGLEGIVGIASAYAIPVNQDLIDTAEASPIDAANLMIKWSLSSEYADRIKGQDEGDLLEKLAKSMAKNVLAEDLKACAAYKNGVAAAKLIDVPSLMVLSAQDKMTPIKHGLETSKVLGSEVEILEEVGHMLPLEAPNEVLACLSRFIV